MSAGRSTFASCITTEFIVARLENSTAAAIFTSCILSDVHLANAKNRELSGIKHAVARSLIKIYSLSVPLRLNFRSRSALSSAPSLFLHFKFKPCGDISVSALPPLNLLQFKPVLALKFKRVRASVSLFLLSASSRLLSKFLPRKFKSRDEIFRYAELGDIGFLPCKFS